MKGIFITGSDTAVGKTMVAGCLARFLSEKGRSVITQKWVQTGCKDIFSSDIAAHIKIMGRGKSAVQKWQSHILPYVFKKPCSPHLACSLEHKTIAAEKIKKSFRLLSENFDFVIVEGAGGTLVPFNKKRFLIDIAAELQLPVLLVAQNKLGAVNHALLTVEALRARKLKILGIMMNNARKEDPRILQDNPRAIRRLSGEKVFGVLPWGNTQEKLYRSFIPIGHKIAKELRNEQLA